MRGMRWAAMAAATILVAGPATADVVIYHEAGQVSEGNEFVYFYVPLPLVEGASYEFSFTFDGAETLKTIHLFEGLHYNAWKEDGGYDFGSDLPTYLTPTYVVGDRSINGSFVTPVATDTFWDNGDIKRDYYITGLHFWLDTQAGPNDEGTSYSFTLAAVPEPATWAMMIAGFGMAGAALRRRQTALS